MRAWYAQQGFHTSLETMFDTWKNACLAKDYRYKSWLHAFYNAAKFCESWYLEKHPIQPRPQAHAEIKKKQSIQVDYASGLKHIQELLANQKLSVDTAIQSSEGTTPEPVLASEIKPK